MNSKKNSRNRTSKHQILSWQNIDDKNCMIWHIVILFFSVVQVQFSPFPTYHCPLPHPFPSPTAILLPFGFVHVSFIYVPWWPFPYFPPLPFSSLPSGCCQFVLYFNVSGYILLACLFCQLCSTYGLDDMVFFIHRLSYFT